MLCIDHGAVAVLLLHLVDVVIEQIDLVGISAELNVSAGGVPEVGHLR
jgi:hypothetical protein